MDEQLKRELRDLAKEALQVQDSVNMSGLVHSWSRSITDLRRLLQNAGTLQINTHPINTLWLYKLCQLNGLVAEPNELVLEAWNEVTKIAQM